ncbi:hypothetical protein KQI36_00185 [Clostridium senegalense]|uniref:hypothetical protein n=1 Tax=Clostridium senegalense TaxID=1465809 RepID=UPI001C10DB96|nr:hypothetical protein [Clostridium senegalense]MBU5225081.1 hypothetical protein [Clostridium senegalense]
MTIKMQRYIFAIVLSIGTILNIFCLVNIIPINYYKISFMIISFVLVSIIITNLFTALPPKERSTYIKDLTRAEKIQAIITAVLIFSWIITIICVMKF